jgi:hypothetical protein
MVHARYSIDNMEVCDWLGLSVVDPFYCSSYAWSLIQELERRHVYKTSGG